MGVNIVTRYLTNNPCYKQDRAISVRGLMLHSIGTPQPDPLVFVKNWNSASYNNACVHGFIGQEAIYITLPCFKLQGIAMRGWHAGAGANNTHIGIEMTEPSSIKYTGGSNFTCSDRAGAIAFVKKNTENAAELFAKLCIFHGLDPMKDGVIISHAEGYRRGIASNHGDPDHLWRGLGMDYNMDKFRADVAALMKKEEEEMTQEQFNKMMADMPQEIFNKKMEKYFAEQRAKPESAWSVKEGAWAKATKAGVVNGLAPQANITRQEVTAILDRLDLIDE